MSFLCRENTEIRQMNSVKYLNLNIDHSIMEVNHRITIKQAELPLTLGCRVN